MIHCKSLKINKKTMSLITQGSGKELCNLDRYEFLALCLLHGFYNPLRKFSSNDTPITDMDRYNDLKDKYNNIVTEMIGIMDVDVIDVESLK